MKIFQIYTVIIVLVAVAVGGGAEVFLMMRRLSGPTPTSPADVTHPMRTASVCGLGYVEPVSEVRSLSFKGGGLIAVCRVGVGQRVPAGEVLMALQDDVERRELAVAEREWVLAKAERDEVIAGVNKYEIAAAERSLELAQERLAHAEKDWDRSLGLIRRNAVPQSEYDTDSSAYRQAVVEVRRAEAQLEHLRHIVTPERSAVAEAKERVAEARKQLALQNLADTQLKAPGDGTVLEILRREGETVSPLMHEPVLLFADVSRLRVRAEFDERHLDELRPGQPVTVSGRSLGKKEYVGKITMIKSVMGKKTVFTRSSVERKDLDVIQVFVDMGPDFKAPVGLRVDVELYPAPVQSTTKATNTP